LDTLLIFSTFFVNSERKKQPKKAIRVKVDGQAHLSGGLLGHALLLQIYRGNMHLTLQKLTQNS